MSTIRLMIGDIAVEDKQVVAPESLEADNLPYLGLEQVQAHTGEILTYENHAVEG